MTRQEQIRNAVDTTFPIPTSEEGRKYEQALMATGFEAGVQWADTHPKSQWISVKDRLPEQDKEVIVLCDDLNIASFYKISFAHVVDKTMYQDYNGWNIPNVVYWFPMPKLPKEQEEML